MQHLTGHADITVLLKIYAHVKENRPEDLAGYINSAL
jgi:site-specific recombinase XerD